MKKYLPIMLMILIGYSFPSHGQQLIFGAHFGYSTADQSDINSLITRANARAGGISTDSLSDAYEGVFTLGYRPSQSSLAYLLRPAVFYAQTDGSGGQNAGFIGKYEYSLLGYSIYPILRYYLLEDATIRFFTQVGIGWGEISGEIKEQNTGDVTADFSGDNLGYLVGLGVEFCFDQGGSHCLNLEANLRIHYIERNITDSASGTFASGSLSQAAPGAEIEIDNRDLGTTMSGVQGIIGYTFYY